LSAREIVCEDLTLALDDLKREGFRLDVIYPADDPHTALLSRDGVSVRLTSQPGAPPPPKALPPFQPSFVLTGSSDSGGEGRAGMLYRDLIPDRLGGRYIASHIRIPDGGPVSDWVHYHRIAVQLIYVRRGWVRVVYEDQGEPFVMREGDLVLQPPAIRHRVLESSARLEVVEITCPAVHETFADPELDLPNGAYRGRKFGRQRFLHHPGAQAPWTSFGSGEAQETAIADATGGLADVRTIRPVGGKPVAFPAHSGELVFGFVLDGSGFLDFDDGFRVGSGDAFVIPPGEPWRLTDGWDDLRLLHVTTALLD
jgi:mannose-6-phosphate isomerase-like protein (cupin superfamily)